jgi:ABC-2 type transport system permease protein
VSKAFEFRFDFYMRIIMDLFYYAVAIAFFRVIFLHTSTLGGWNESQMMVFVSGYLIVDAINMTVFANNMWGLAPIINKGELDYYLVRPVSSLFFLSLRDFAANSFLNLLCAFGIFVWAIHGYTPWPGIAKIVLFFLMLFNGSIIFASLNVMANALTFWTHSPRGFGELVWYMTKFSEKPDRIYTGFTRKVLTLVLPYAVVSSFPARLLLEAFSWHILLHMIGVSLFFVGMLILLWNRGLCDYSSASS